MHAIFPWETSPANGGARAIVLSPADVGFPANMNWTSPLAKDWIEREFKVKYAARSVRELMHRLGLSNHYE